MPEAGVTTRRRTNELFSFNSFWTRTGFGGTLGPTRRGETITGTQTTVSEGHPFHSTIKRGEFRGDLGGNFYTERQYLEDLPKKDREVGVTYQLRSTNPLSIVTETWRGPVFAGSDGKPLSKAFPPVLKASDDDLDELGATAIARCKPTNPPADAATFLGELVKDGLPSLVGSQVWREKALTGKNLGSEYLNVQFGWRPVVDDVNKFLHTVKHADTVLAQYERDSGKVVRRRFNFPIEKTVSSPIECATHGIHGLATSGGGFKSVGKTFRIDTTIRKRWFSGAFTYYLPSGYDSRSALSRYRLLADRLGVDLTPDTLWNLAPWSWAIDWFSNAGDVVNNVSDFGLQGLVMRYGYIMETSIVKHTYIQVGATLQGGIPIPVDPITFVSETKVRRKANPFGFGVNWDGLSSFQTSILVALGLTKR